MLDRRTVAPVHDSGLWHLLRGRRAAVEDVAVLIGAVSDNLATNVLLDLLGIEAVQDRAQAAGPGRLDAARPRPRRAAGASIPTC